MAQDLRESKIKYNTHVDADPLSQVSAIVDNDEQKAKELWDAQENL